jgi:glycosyltransferase involved in cell wall biosynthesis
MEGQHGQVEISVVLPCYNEEDAIGLVIDDVKRVMDETEYEYELLVVDDASTDRTADIAEAKGGRLIRRAVNGGSGAARKTGIRHARGDIIVMLDADGTYAAADIPRMLSYFPQYDQVNGARTSEQGTLKLLRTPAKWFIRQLARDLTGVNIPDLNTGLKAFKREIMKKYLWAIPDGFSCVSTMTLAFLCNGYAVKWIPIEYHPRIGRSKFHPLKDTYNYILTVIRIVMYFDPLRVFLPLSLLLLVFGIIKTFVDLLFIVHKMQLSDIVIIMTAILVGVVGLLADLIVAQGKAVANKSE